VFENSFNPEINATSSSQLFPKFRSFGNGVYGDAAFLSRGTSCLVRKNYAICLSKEIELKFVLEIFKNFCRNMDLEKQNQRSIGLLLKHFSICKLFLE
jgi:hypothetical protein